MTQTLTALNGLIDIFRGTVIADFERIISYVIEQKGIPVGENNALFSMKTLPVLNALLTNPIKHDLERPIQKNFPHLHAINALLRFSGLARVIQTKNESILYINQETYCSWISLSKEEKYYNLLPIIFLSDISDALGERISGLSNYYSLYWLINHTEETKRFENYDDQRTFSYTFPSHQLGFYELFGLITIERADPEPGCGWRFVSVEPTPFGIAMAKILMANINELHLYYENESFNDRRNIFQKILCPYIPSWKSNFTIFPPKPFEGIQIFKVSLGKSWKIIAVDSKITLSDFAYIILEEFNFGSDHLYYFLYKDWRGIATKIYHEYVTEVSCFADDYTIGSLNLEVGQPMVFLFDFGDQWEFKIRREPNQETKELGLLKSGGSPVPNQFPAWDEE